MCVAATIRPASMMRSCVLSLIHNGIKQLRARYVSHTEGNKNRVIAPLCKLNSYQSTTKFSNYVCLTQICTIMVKTKFYFLSSDPSFKARRPNTIKSKPMQTCWGTQCHLTSQRHADRKQKKLHKTRGSAWCLTASANSNSNELLGSQWIKAI